MVIGAAGVQLLLVMVIEPFPDTPLIVAVMVAIPTETPVTTPPETVATEVGVLVQVTVEVKSFVLPSEYIPVAVIWRPSPMPPARGTGVNGGGATVMDCRVTAGGLGLL
jgi:hypothetical protein